MQDLIVFAAVIGAVGYLGKHWWNAAKGSGCKSCASNKTAAPQEPQLVQIDLGGSWK